MGRRLRVATFNLESLDDRPHAAGSFADRLAILAPQLQRLRADVLCLQEVNAREESRHGPRHLTALDALLAESGYGGYERAVTVNRAGRRYSDRHNLVVVSRLPIIEQHQVWHDHVAAPRYAPQGAADMAVEWDRPLLHVVVRLSDGRPLHVLNLHLRAPRAAFLAGHKVHGVWDSVGAWAEGFFLAAMKSAGQAVEARLVVDRIFADDPAALVVVCGDFNADEREAPLRIIRGDEEDTHNGHLGPQTLVGLDRSLAGSQRFSVIHHGRRLMLDHMLASRALVGWYVGIEVHNEALGDELVSPSLIHAPPDSYHAPLVAEFVRPAESEPVPSRPGGADQTASTTEPAASEDEP